MRIALWFARFFVTRPERPTANLGAITAPGAITGEYFVGGNLERKAFERADKTIEFAFASGALDPRLGDETFSVRWTGFLFFDQPGRWHLCGQVDDGVRIFFDDRALVDDWERQAVRTVCGTVTVEPGWYPLRVEYRRGAGGGAITLLRGPPRRGLEVVPPWLLCCGRPGEAPASERSARAELR